ncbi:MAG: hypothetical protein RTU92_02245, partial [Candidatus Thorarchaeota archaeon]
KSKTYDKRPIIDQEMIDLIQEHGKPEKKSWKLTLRQLTDLANDENVKIAAKAVEFIQRIFMNPSNLVLDECAIAESLGIKVLAVPYDIRYFRKSGRVSVAWSARTANSEEALKLAIIAPPNDVKKREILKRWIRSKLIDADKYWNEFVRKGFEIERWWLDE